VSAQCAGRTTVGVKAQSAVYVVERVDWDSDVLPHAAVIWRFGVSSRRSDAP